MSKYFWISYFNGPRIVSDSPFRTLFA